jgi:tryptophan 7-halogenase
MIKRVVVLGGGSAGFLAAIALKIQFPDLGVAVLRSQELGIIGVGEGTTGFFPTYIHGRLRINPAEFHRLAQPSWKLGIRFVDWGPRPYFDYTFRPQVTSRFVKLPKPTGYYCYENFEYGDLASALMSHDKVFLRNRDGSPAVGSDASYHIENQHFVAFLEGCAARLGVALTDDTVQGVQQNDAGVTGLLLKTGRIETADLYVDCSGFASVLLGKTFREPFISFKTTLFCDRAVVGGWDRTTEPIKPYTTAQGMSAGWCWQIEHEHRINRGYVYSSSFLSDDEAEREFRAKNSNIRTTRIVKFITGRYDRAWVKNVVAIGNACGFVEPLEATSLAVICDECDSLVNSLGECDFRPTPTVCRQFNHRAALRWDEIRQFLGIHYKFNTALDTPFWRECREKVDLGVAVGLVEYFQENGPGLSHRGTLLNPLSQFGLEGYWTLLIGQKVPYQRSYVPTLPERYMWHQIQQTLKSKALAAFSIKEAFAVIRSPEYSWPSELYTQLMFHTPI